MIRINEKTIEKFFFLSAFFSALVTCSIFAFLFVLGLPLFSGGRFFSIITQPWAPHLGHFGIYPMIAGTLAVSLLTMVVAFPLSLGCAILISVVDRGKMSWLLRKTVEMMTGVPTVIYGFVGIFLLVPLVREIFEAGSGMCVLSAVLMLTLLVSPTMILFFCDSFERVPRSYGDAVLAVGGTEIQKFLYVTLPHSWTGIVIGFTLSLGRALGDTLVALMIAGNAVQVPGSLFDSARTLTSHIALVFAADYNSMEFKAIFACGIFLYLFTTILVCAVRLVGGRRKMAG
ncbi:MAG: ABC transporter permease subunit [Desulfobulbaceae bacterium]|nr:ABC transporter permease subunit [Desulfobulbaceae bacterium]